MFRFQCNYRYLQHQFSCLEPRHNVQYNNKLSLRYAIVECTVESLSCATIFHYFFFTLIFYEIVLNKKTTWKVNNKWWRLMCAYVCSVRNHTVGEHTRWCETWSINAAIAVIWWVIWAYNPLFVLMFCFIYLTETVLLPVLVVVVTATWTAIMTTAAVIVEENINKNSETRVNFS